jgi:hypothetical protein
LREKLVCLFHPLINAFINEHIVIQLPMDLSMLWHLHQVKKIGLSWLWVIPWHGAPVKVDDVSYHGTSIIYGLPRHFLKI